MRNSIVPQLPQFTELNELELKQTEGGTKAGAAAWAAFAKDMNRIISRATTTRSNSVRVVPILIGL